PIYSVIVFHAVWVGRRAPGLLVGRAGRNGPGGERDRPAARWPVGRVDPTHPGRQVLVDQLGQGGGERGQLLRGEPDVVGVRHHRRLSPRRRLAVLGGLPR